MTHLSFEREVDLTLVQQNLRQIVDALGFSYELEINCPERFVAHGILKDLHGDYLSEGSGKGEAYEIGAIAEAIEHFCLEEEDSKRLNQLRGLQSHKGPPEWKASRADAPVEKPLVLSNSIKMSSYEIAGQKFLSKDGIFKSLTRFPEVSLDCLPFVKRSTNEAIFIPASFCSPFFSPEKWTPADIFLRKYSTNSGVAFGSSLNEALLHGLNEVLERHFLSQFFLFLALDEPFDFHTISLQKCPQALEIVRGRGLPELQADLVYKATPGGLHFCAAIQRGVDRPLALIGSGVSASQEHAFKRALYELIQQNELYNDEICAEDIMTGEFLDLSPQLHRLKDCTVEISHPNSFTVSKDEAWRPLEDLVNISLGELDRDQPLLYRVLREFGSQGVVAQVYIPGLERFNLIRCNGAMVAPQKVLRQ